MTTPRNRSEAEIAGYRAVLKTIHSSAVHMPFTANVVLQLHRDLYRFAPQPGGRWKNSDNLVTEERAGGTVAVRLTPVSALDTPAAARARSSSVSSRIRPRRHASPPRWDSQQSRERLGRVPNRG
jgi:hypothetical protein